MQNEKFEYFIKYYWLFTKEFTNSEIYKCASKIPADAFIDPTPAQIQLIPFDEIIFSMEKEEILKILSWLKYQFQMLASTEANKTIINFVDLLGSRLTAILSIKENNKK